MSEFVSIVIDDRQLVEALTRLERAGGDLKPAMRKIAQTLAKVTEDNFAAEGRPKWKPLSEVTVHMRLGGSKAYKKDGKLTKAAQRRQDAGFRILQDTGQLASSITTQADSQRAAIGSNLVYAAIHQFGGDAGHGRKVAIPARPYLPITEDGTLQEEARDEVLEAVLRHLATAL